MEYPKIISGIENLADNSDRLRIRTGHLARSNRGDLQAALESREPDELSEPLDFSDPNELDKKL